MIQVIENTITGVNDKKDLDLMEGISHRNKYAC